MRYLALIIAFFIFVLLFTYTFKIIKRLLSHIDKLKKLNIISFCLTSIIFLIIIINIRKDLTIFIILAHFLIISLIFDGLNIIIKKYKINFWTIAYKYSIFPILISMILSIYGIYNASNIVKTEYTIQSEKIKNDYKIALISDVHFGKSVSFNQLEKYKELLSQENLDFIVLAGDIVDEQTLPSDYDNIFSILGNIKSKYGVFYVHGNHDENRYLNPTYNRNQQLLSAITKSNITLLNENSSEINDELTITGRLDYSYKNTGKRLKADEIIKPLNKEKFLIVADHQPYFYEENMEAGFNLQLSGHTHAGQIFPIGFITRAIDFDYGKLEFDHFNLIVSSGFGVWGASFRTEEHSEYVIIHLANTSIK